MNGTDRDVQVRRLVGRVIREWREKRLKISEENFAVRYHMSDRFLRMIQAGQHLPSCKRFVEMVLDMDWRSRVKLMVGFMKIKRGETIKGGVLPPLSEGQEA